MLLGIRTWLIGMKCAKGFRLRGAVDSVVLTWGCSTVVTECTWIGVIAAGLGGVLSCRIKLRGWSACGLFYSGHG